MIAQLAIALGIPISFNNIIISGVIGGGLAGGSAGVAPEDTALAHRATDGRHHVQHRHRAVERGERVCQRVVRQR
jgi:phosphate/sulfate permease